MRILFIPAFVPLLKNLLLTLLGHMTIVRCRHHKQPNKFSAPNNIPLTHRETMRARKNANRVSQPRRNSGKSSNQRRTCPGKQGPWQPQRYVGQTQPNARTEELRSSKSACSWDYARLVSEIEGVMSDDIEANIGYFPLPTSHSRCQAMNFP